MTGGFLFGQSNNNAQAANAYLPPFVDTFDNGIGTWENTAVGGTTASWAVAGGKATYSGGANWTRATYLLRPASEAMQDGKIEMSFAKSDVPSGSAVAVIARYNAPATRHFAAWVFPSANDIEIVYRINAGFEQKATNTSVDFSGVTNIRAELIVDTVSATQVDLTFSVYNADTDALVAAPLTFSDTSGLVPNSGQWGLAGYNGGSSIDTVKIFKTSADLASAVNNKNIKFGGSASLTLTDDEDRTVTLSDNGAGGSFSPSATITLNSGNSYTQAVTYTPVKAGNVLISGTADNDETIDETVFVSPYSTTIGYIGDSLTIGQGVAAANNAVSVATDTLGSGTGFVNRGVGGTTTANWLNTYLSPAITAFQSQNVDVVHIMLGTNDVLNSNLVPAATYRANMESIIAQLKSAGFRQVILSKPIYFVPSGQYFNQASLDLLAEYSTAIDGLVADSAGYVRLGDTAAYDWFKDNAATALSGDGVHPTVAGYAKLGEFWAGAIKADLEYEITPDHSWTDSVSSFTLGDSKTLTHSVDKYFGEFASVVSVDGNTLTSGSDYTASAGSTIIELSNAYLNGLTAGNHTLTVAFNGGVTVSSSFTILAQNGGGSNSGGNNGSGVPGAPNTGLFGLGYGTTMAGFAILTIITAFGVVLVGRKLAKQN